jgi:hypothetical protein
VYNGGLIGNDDACVHADNSMTSCGYPNSTDSCTKTWHHNWVHDCREKCMRGDDYTWQLHGHHLVIWWVDRVQRQALYHCVTACPAVEKGVGGGVGRAHHVFSSPI